MEMLGKSVNGERIDGSTEIVRKRMKNVDESHARNLRAQARRKSKIGMSKASTGIGRLTAPHLVLRLDLVSRSTGCRDSAESVSRMCLPRSTKAPA
jgi:hypothetical protein